MSGMADPKTIRINDADIPDRLETLERNLKKTSANVSGVVRQLVDAYNLFVAENGHAPNFPVRLTPIGTEKKKRKP